MNNKHWNDWKTTTTLLYYQPTKDVFTVVMDKTDYFDKMDALVNDKQTYEELKRDPEVKCCVKSREPEIKSAENICFLLEI